MDELRLQEMSIATADAECYRQAGIEHAHQATEARVEQELLARNGDKLIAMQESRDDALERAASLLTTSTP